MLEDQELLLLLIEMQLVTQKHYKSWSRKEQIFKVGSKAYWSPQKYLEIFYLWA